MRNISNEPLMILPKLTKEFKHNMRQDAYLILYCLSQHCNNVFSKFLFDANSENVIKFKKITRKHRDALQSNDLTWLEPYKTNGYNVIEISGTFEHNSQYFVFVRYEPLPEYFEMKHFSRKSMVEAVATDILNYNSVEGLQFSKHVIDFFSTYPESFSILNENTKTVYALPVSAYYGTQTKYLNEVLLFGKEYHKSSNNMIQLTSFEISKKQSMFAYELDNQHCIIKLAFKDSDIQQIHNLKRRKLIYKDSYIYLKSDETIRINVNLPLADMTNLKIYDIDTLKKEFTIRVSINDISNLESSMLLPHYDKTINKMNAKIIHYLLFLDDFSFSTEAQVDKTFHSFNGDIFYYTTDIEDLFVTSIKNVYK